MYEYGDTLQPGYGDPYSDLAVGGVQQNPSVTTTQVPASSLAVQQYDPVEFQKQIARITQAARTKSFGANGELTKQLDQYGETGPQYSPEAMDYFNAVNDYLSNNGTGYNLSTHNTASYDPQKKFYAPITNEQAQAFAAQPLADQFVANFGYTGKDPTNWGAGNLEFSPNDQYRIVDRATGKELYNGTGYAAGDQISKLASGLTDSAGNQANWSIQKADPSGNWTQQYEHIPEDNGFGTFLKLALPMALGPMGGLFGAAGGAGLGLGSAATGALGAALGTGLAGVASGDSIGDILKSAALSGGLTYGGAQLGGALGNVGKTAANVGKTASNIASGLGTVGADGIVTVLAPSLVQAVAPVVGSVAGAASDLAAKPPVDNDGILVSATRLQSAADALKAGTATAGSLAAQGFTNGQIEAAQQLADSQISSVAKTPTETPLAVPNVTTPPQTAPGTGDITVTGMKSTPTESPKSIVPPLPDVITVSHAPVKPPEATAGEIAAATGLTLAEAASLGSGPPAEPTPAPKSTASKILDAAKGAALLSGLLGGGSGSSGSGGNYLGTGNLSPTFTASLPPPNLPGLTGGAGTTGPRTPSDLAVHGLSSNPQDWYRYGYGPQQSFFNYVPQGAPNTSKAYTGYADGGAVDYDYAAAKRAGVRPDKRGHMPDTYKLPNHMTFSDDSIHSTPETPGGKWRQGSDGKWVFWPSEYNMQQHPMAVMQDYFNRVEPDSAAIYPSDFRLNKAGGGDVEGPGTGRSDSIPARLSDGEYVMDAETVALLGDGSTKAGAKKLDTFRVNLRKHKGRNLARGEFSVKAKAPERYLAGGRT